MERLFAIGDIHGCYDQLLDLMDQIPIDWSRDRLVFMGDYIDRGPSSFEVVDYLVELGSRHPSSVFLKGNHEQMLADYLSGKDRMTYLYNGGQQTLESYLIHAGPDAPGPIPPAHLRFFESLVLYFETESYIFVHAGLRQNVPLSQQDPEDLLWIREKFVNTKYSFGKRVVFGHTPLQEPLVETNKIGIDTGAVYGNKLTCVQLPEELFYFSQSG
jgi:serine/threonine protein phosphatase 1